MQFPIMNPNGYKGSIRNFLDSHVKQALPPAEQLISWQTALKSYLSESEALHIVRQFQTNKSRGRIVSTAGNMACRYMVSDNEAALWCFMRAFKSTFAPKDIEIKRFISEQRVASLLTFRHLISPYLAAHKNHLPNPKVLSA